MASSSERVRDGEAPGPVPSAPLRAVDAVSFVEGRLTAALGRLAVYETAVTALAVVAQRLAALAEVDEIVAATPALALALHPGAAVALLEVAVDGAVTVRSRGGAAFEAPHWLEAEASALVCAAAARDGGARGAGRSGRAVLVPVGRPSERRVLAVEPDAASESAAEVVEPLAILASLVGSALESARAAAARHESEARARAMLAASEDGVLLLDRDGVVAGANARAADALGLAPGAVAGRRLADVPGLEPLAAVVAGEREPGEIVALPRGDAAVRVERWDDGVAITLRPLRSGRGPLRRSSAPIARYTFDDLVGEAPAFLRVLEEARRAAASDLPVLVCGESGTGKELLAQAIHHASPRAAEPFVGINVTAIPHDLLESELFGYEPGSFTGASASGHPGKFELAGAGTLLLDEIGDMPADMQPKLLRVLQERLVQRVGGIRDIRVRARIVATSHRDLPEAVSTGRFRRDLFHRLCVIHLHLPPLRERLGDVPLLVEHQLRKHAARTGRRVRVAPAVLHALASYDWPGNVRELVNLLEGELGILAPDEAVLARVPGPLLQAGRLAGDPGPALLPLSELERRACAETLARFEGNVARAALALGVPKRTLYAKMKRWGMQAPRAAHASGDRCPHAG